MKELTIEQKAQRYDEAISKMKEIITMDNNPVIPREIGQCIFPELRESEDERIRKELIDFVKSRLAGFPQCEKFIAWLEKQGEQSFAIRWHDVSLIPREMEELLVEWDSNDATWHDVAFYHADSKTFWNGERRVEDVTRWCYIDDLLEKQSEPKPTDAEMKELLRTEYEKGRADAIAETQVAWSEEDKAMLKETLALIETVEDINKAKDGFLDVKMWLKSLKPHTQWKPSEKQMEALDYYANSLCTYCDRQDDLRSLFNVIKKL